MKRMVMPYLLVMALLISLGGCKVGGQDTVVLVAAPGKIKFIYNIPEPGREDLYIRVIGNWERETEDEPESHQSSTANIEFDKTFELPAVNQKIDNILEPAIENLRNGLWRIEIRVTGSEPYFCDQEIFRGQTTEITLQRWSEGCTCNKGCEAP
jgi:hypothetical protein